MGMAHRLAHNICLELCSCHVLSGWLHEGSVGDSESVRRGDRSKLKKANPKTHVINSAYSYVRDGAPALASAPLLLPPCPLSANEKHFYRYAARRVTQKSVILRRVSSTHPVAAAGTGANAVLVSEI